MGYYQGDYYMAGFQLPDTSKGQAGWGATLSKALTAAGGWQGVAKGAANVAGMFLPGVVGKGLTMATGLIPGPTSPAIQGGGLAALPRGGLGGGRRYRRTNVANVRALRRAMRRVQGFSKLARSTVSFTSRVKMRKRRRR